MFGIRTPTVRGLIIINGHISHDFGWLLIRPRATELARSGPREIVNQSSRPRPSKVSENTFLANWANLRCPINLNAAFENLLAMKRNETKLLPINLSLKLYICVFVCARRCAYVCVCSLMGVRDLKAKLQARQNTKKRHCYYLSCGVVLRPSRSIELPVVLLAS